VSVVVLGYHEMGCTGLRALLRRGVPVSAVFTYRDDPDENCWFGSVASLATGAGIPVFLTESIHDARWIGHLRALRPDVLFSFYYRHILRRPILEVPRLGAYNLHGSLLPRYRGRCPLNWQLVHGERESGVTLHVMTPRADAGDIVGQERVAVGPDDTAGELIKTTDSWIEFLMVKGIEASFDRIYNDQFARVFIIREEKSVGIFDLYNTKKKKLSPYVHNFRDDQLKAQIESCWSEFSGRPNN